MNERLEEWLAMSKLNELIDRKDGKKSNPLVIFLAIFGAISLGCVIAYAIYRFMTPDYFEDYDDEFDDDYEDEDEEEQEAVREAVKKEKEDTAEK